MHARDDAFSVGVDFLVNGQADPRHDTHVGDHIGRIGQLDADLRHRRADLPHAERQHIHGAPPHAAVEEILQLVAHFKWVCPVVRRAGTVLRKGADERAVFHSGHITRIGPGIVAARPQFLVELDESASLHHLFAERVIFLMGTVHPMDGVGLSQSEYFLDPLQEVFVTGKRHGRIAARDRCTA